MTKALRRAISPLNYSNIDEEEEDTHSPDEED
jgi:hypothetical protein